MRSLFALAFLLAACSHEDQKITPGDTASAVPPEDTGASQDAGDDISGAVELAFDEDGMAWAEEAVDPAGDRDFFYLQPEPGYRLLAYTYVYGQWGTTSPDTVLRLYDSSGELIAENDDMPYRFWETDSGLLWQATDPEGYYLEVLEWSDWDPDSDGPVGGPEYVYDLYVYQAPIDEDDANDTFDEADAQYEGDEPIYYLLGSTEHTISEYAWMFYGQMDEPGDVDIWRIGPFEEGGHWQWSFWPTTYQSLSPVVTLYDDEGRVIGQTTTPAWTTDAVVLNDAAITRYLEAGRAYYLEVRDADGEGGTGEGYFYPGMIYGYWTAETIPLEEETNDPLELALPMSLHESSSTEGYYSAYWFGVLEGDGDAEDDFMLISADTGGFDGLYLNVYLGTALHGSLLDAVVTVYQEQDGELVELGTATDAVEGDYLDDPELWDLPLSGDGSVYVSIAPEDSSAELGPGCFYYVYLSVYGSPIHGG